MNSPTHSLDLTQKTLRIHGKNTKLRNKKQHETHRTMIDSYLCEWMGQQRDRSKILFDHIIVRVAAHVPTM